MAQPPRLKSLDLRNTRIDDSEAVAAHLRSLFPSLGEVIFDMYNARDNQVEMTEAWGKVQKAILETS